MGPLRIILFGCPRISHDGARWTRQQTRKAQSLLAYLIMSGRRLHSREALVELLWSESSQEQARGALRTTIWRLRAVVEPDAQMKGTYLLTAPSGEIGINWDSDIWCDAKCFEAGVDVAVAQTCDSLSECDVRNVRTALDLYTGELLEGFYDDWIIRERERLRSLRSKALSMLMRAASARSDWEAAIAVAENILAEDPLRESIHREVIRCHLRLGQQVQALRRYERCARLLRVELGIDPMPETQALLATILGEGRDAPLASQHGREGQAALGHVEDAIRRLEEVRRYFRRTLRAELGGSGP